MAKEVTEETIVKLNKEEVSYLPTFYSSISVANAAETWKKKSVSIISPKSGRILRQKKKSEKNSAKTEPNGKDSTGFFARLFEDFKKAKVSDYAYQQSNVRRNSSYKPFWATKTVESVMKTKIEEPEISSKKVEFVEASNVVSNKSIAFSKEVIGSPKVTLSNDKDDNDNTPVVKLSTVDHHAEYRLRTPPSYNGSKMYMPTGEQLFWVRFDLYLIHYKPVRNYFGTIFYFVI